MKRALFALGLFIALGSNVAFADDAEDFCNSVWKPNTPSLTRCINEQRTAKAKAENFTGFVRSLCQSRWDIDFVEMLDCIELQNAAKAYVDLLPGSPELSACKQNGDGDSEVIAYCVDENWQDNPLRGIPLEGEASGIESAPAPVVAPVLRAVSGLEGPLSVSFLPSGVLVLDGEVLALSGIEVAMPRKTAELFTRLWVGRDIYLESENKGSDRAYLYVVAGAGEWSGKGLRFDQINLRLVEAGLAVPAETPNKTRYQHFYINAAARAEMDKIGTWANR